MVTREEKQCVAFVASVAVLMSVTISVLLIFTSVRDSNDPQVQESSVVYNTVKDALEWFVSLRN